MSSVAWADDAPENASEFLFGDWAGKRSALEESGLAIESILTTDVISNFAGNTNRTTETLFNYDLTFTLDTEKAGLWDGGTAFLYVLGNTGRSPQGLSVLQAVDNVDADEDLKVYEAWYDQQFFDGQFAILAGLYDYNSEFYALDYASTLINSSFGIGIDAAQVGPSLFPEAALALRLRYNPSSHVYVQGVLNDGVPGDPNHSHGTRIRLDSDDGLFYGLELGETSSEDETKTAYHKLALGLWFQTAKYEDFAGRERDENNGVYLIGESSIYREEDEEQGLGFFFQSGYASKRKNQVEWYLGAGFQYVGGFEGRDKDVLALGLANARNGEPYLTLSEGAATRTESILELTYILQLTSYLALQPDLQWVINPGRRERTGRCPRGTTSNSDCNVEGYWPAGLEWRNSRTCIRSSSPAICFF